MFPILFTFILSHVSEHGEHAPATGKRVSRHTFERNPRRKRRLPPRAEYVKASTIIILDDISTPTSLLRELKKFFPQNGTSM